MTSSLLKKTRKINMLLQRAGGEPIEFSKLAEAFGDNVEANCYVLNKKGKLMGSYLVDRVELEALDKIESEGYIGDDFNHHLLQFNETEFLEKSDDKKCYFDDVTECPFNHRFLAVVPIKGRGERQGTLLFTRSDQNFTDEDAILSEYGATVIALEIFRLKNEALEEETRKREAVQIAVDTLSFSEIAAMKKIFENLEGDEGYLVASKIADEARITRSVIVNALRKLESAGVIQSRSLGMKGTYIKILNDQLKEEFERRDM
jgi:transcriptional pleiotropic repressor